MDRNTQNKAIELYKNGLTVYEVGAELGLSYVTIWNILKNNEVDMRPRGVAKGTKFVKDSGEFIVTKRFPDGTNKPKDVLIFETNAKINVPEGFAVLHLDGRKSNCELINLALVTVEYYKEFMGEYPPYYKPKKSSNKDNNKKKSKKTTNKKKK